MTEFAANMEQSRRMSAAFAVMDMLSANRTSAPEVWEKITDLLGPAVDALLDMYEDASEKRAKALEQAWDALEGRTRR